MSDGLIPRELEFPNKEKSVFHEKLNIATLSYVSVNNIQFS